NHDHPRIASRFDADGRGEARALVAATMLATLRGTPFLYQGDELALRDAPPVPGADIAGRDGCRAPIPWRSPADAGPGCGFTAGTPWLPPATDAERTNVEVQRAD